MTPLLERWPFVRTTLPAILWTILIFIASSIPSNEMPSSTIFQYDKLIHASVFGVLCFLLYRALVLRTPPTGERRAMILSAGATILYGATDELHQLLVPGRSCDIFDWAADALGAMVCILLVVILNRRRKATIPELPPTSSTAGSRDAAPDRSKTPLR